MRNALDGLFADAEKAGGHLRDHVVVVGPHPFHEAALARAGEGVPGHGRPGLRKLRRVADGAEGHAAAVPGHIDPDPGAAVVAAVQFQARIDFIFPELDGRFFRKLEPDAVEAAARVARLEFIPVILGRNLAAFRHLPGGEDHLGGPPVIAEDLHHRVFLDAQGALGTGRDAVAPFFFAFRPEAEVALGKGEVFIPGLQDMDALGTQVDALAAGRAFLLVPQDDIFGDLIPVSGQSGPDGTLLPELRRTRSSAFSPE